ncbi:MAG: hypothetical protein PHS14_07675 [Elusimicrobia bacterium]|nr:hypothetical protein [Elusimicrobiota bacterium]
MKKRCEIMVRAGTYRAPGQCEKRRRLRALKLGGVAVTVCTVHARVLDRGRRLEVAR